MSVANAVTVLRILLTPVLIFTLIKALGHEPFRYLGAGILLIIGLSDILDGYLAKKRDEVTALGRYLDPLADKLVVVSLCLLLSSSVWPQPRLPSWLAGVMISREAMLLFGTFALVRIVERFEPAPNLPGKANNVSQLVMFGTTIMGNTIPLALLSPLWWIAALTTILSGISYLWMGMGMIATRPKFERSI